MVPHDPRIAEGRRGLGSMNLMEGENESILPLTKEFIHADICAALA